MTERPTFALAATMTLIAQTAFDPRLAHLPCWLSTLEPALRQALFWGPFALALAGVIALLRTPATTAALAGLAGYVVAHAAFPAQIDRYGYPLTPVFVLLVGAGVAAAWTRLKRIRVSTGVARLVLLTIGLVFAAVLVGATGGGTLLSGRPAVLGLVAVAAVWAAPLAFRRHRLAHTVLLVGAAALLLTQVRTASALLGTGQEMKNQVEAARWIRAHAPPDMRVLADLPGLLRLYAGRTPPDRFLGFEDIESATWTEILAECHRRQIGYIIWHDALWDVHGGYYADRMRLARFDLLSHAENVPGVQVERRLPNFPNLVILRVMPETE